MAYCTKAQRILDGTFMTQRRQKPWGLQNDGDLWEHFYKAAMTKRPSAMRVSWTKGHSTDKHVEEGITTMHNKIHNDKVDAIADRGIS